MNLKKCKNYIAFIVMAILLFTVVFPLETFATTEPSSQDTDTTSISFEVKLEITGDTPTKDEKFTFVIDAAEGSPLPDTSYTTRSGAGVAKFGEIKFTKPGEYQYTIYQQNDGIKNYTYDTKSYIINVNVRYSNSQLVATCVAYSGKQRDAKEPEILFINEYSDPDPTPVDSDDETTSANPTYIKSPSTRNKVNLILWIALIFVGFIDLIVCVIYLKMAKNYKRSNDISITRHKEK